MPETPEAAEIDTAKLFKLDDSQRKRLLLRERL
jgi:hypothetical protein